MMIQVAYLEWMWKVRMEIKFDLQLECGSDYKLGCVMEIRLDS
jgi:hypothetical protein